MKRLLGTVLACVAASTLLASAQDGTWTQVLRWADSEHIKTESFDIKSQQWRVTWSLTEDEPLGSLLQIHVRKSADHSVVAIGATNFDLGQGRSGITPLEGAGRYYLEISSLKANWVVTIEELVDPYAEEFEKAKLAIRDGDKVKERDVILRYDRTSVSMLDEKTRELLRSVAFENLTAAEYSYARSDRKHWLLLRETDSYAQIQLESDNYRQVIQALEVRTGLTVAGVR